MSKNPSVQVFRRAEDRARQLHQKICWMMMMVVVMKMVTVVVMMTRATMMLVLLVVRAVVVGMGLGLEVVG